MLPVPESAMRPLWPASLQQSNCEVPAVTTSSPLPLKSWIFSTDDHILEATANLSDGRVLKLNTTVQCKLPGP